MKFLLLSFLVLVGVATSQKCSPNEASGVGVLSSAAFWKDIDGADKVEELTDKTYAGYVKKDQKTFVMMYLPS